VCCETNYLFETVFLIHIAPLITRGLERINKEDLCFESEEYESSQALECVSAPALPLLQEEFLSNISEAAQPAQESTSLIEENISSTCSSPPLRMNKHTPTICGRINTSDDFFNHKELAKDQKRCKHEVITLSLPPQVADKVEYHTRHPYLMPPKKPNNSKDEVVGSTHVPLPPLKVNKQPGSTYCSRYGFSYGFTDEMEDAEDALGKFGDKQIISLSLPIVMDKSYSIWRSTPEQEEEYKRKRKESGDGFKPFPPNWDKELPKKQNFAAWGAPFRSTQYSQVTHLVN